MKANDCPDCSEPLFSPFTSCKCGWRSVQKKHNGNPHKFGVRIGDTWIDKQCAWNDHGHRCDLYGLMSLATSGEGPYYCRDHFADVMHWTREPAKPDPKRVGELLDALKAFRRKAA